jgi:hypothetical protein
MTFHVDQEGDEGRLWLKMGFDLLESFLAFRLIQA